ncbi:MAG TPA: hypothetical protein VHG53_03020 [Candidatus Limnocylindria bacterium]|nr:hypothetical protein [Candidatus Limnocylindria bacterium]
MTRHARVCDAAGPCGYELQRSLARQGFDCRVIAPALIRKRQGQPVKSDRRNARKLWRLFRAGELTALRIPPPEEEAVRDLLRHDRIYRDRKAWTGRHLVWVRAQRCAVPGLDRVLVEHRAALEERVAQRDQIARELLAIAAQPPCTEGVRRLASLRGIRALTGLTLLVEVGELARFAWLPVSWPAPAWCPASTPAAGAAPRPHPRTWWEAASGAPLPCGSNPRISETA